VTGARPAQLLLLLAAAPARGAEGPLPPGAQALLDALHDIHEPAAPGALPPAPGWYVLATALLLALVAAAVLLRRRRARTRPVRAALAELDAWERAARSGGDPVGHAETLAALLRRVALVRYPRPEVAPLGGDAFLAFLDRTLGEAHFRDGPGRVLGDARYRGRIELDVPALAALARRWLQEHEDGPTVTVSSPAGEAA
jgi:hypothetical protein